ncbi:hypothetical protein A3K73_06715 [Candidatus Pacearchaeota archaeon RBG_13_36_9]|nr:MAG: hypothetical protein A3K73_06715 [Candidatus Pacearchaeota archaeon RBG_13_36_9]
MLSKEQLRYWKESVDKIIKEHPLKFIQLEVTRACNLNCIHCGSPSEGTNFKEQLSREEIKKTLEKIATEIIDPNYFNHLMFVGGEPFSRRDLIDIIQDTSKIQVNGRRVYTNTQIQTNGTYLGDNPKLLDKLKELGITGFGISIDGLEKTHNLFRRGKDVFRKTYSAAQEAIARGFSVSISTVANQSNISELPVLSNLIRDELKPNFWRIMLLDPIGRARLDKNYLLSPEQVKKIIGFIYKEHVEHVKEVYQEGRGTKIELGCGGWCGEQLEGMIRPYLWHCISGISMLGIMYDGAIGGCTNISRDFIEGNIRTDDITKVWNDRFEKFREFDWKKIDECQDCKEFEFCDGGPMHYRLGDRKMIFCLYQTLENDMDYRGMATNEVLKTKAGN